MLWLKNVNVGGSTMGLSTALSLLIYGVDVCGSAPTGRALRVVSDLEERKSEEQKKIVDMLSFFVSVMDGDYKGVRVVKGWLFLSGLSWRNESMWNDAG